MLEIHKLSARHTFRKYFSCICRQVRFNKTCAIHHICRHRQKFGLNFLNIFFCIFNVFPHTLKALFENLLWPDCPWCGAGCWVLSHPCVSFPITLSPAQLHRPYGQGIQTFRFLVHSLKWGLVLPNYIAKCVSLAKSLEWKCLWYKFTFNADPL